MANTWTVPDTSLPNHSGLAIYPSGWSQTTVEPLKGFVAFQQNKLTPVSYPLLKNISGTLPIADLALRAV